MKFPIFLLLLTVAKGHDSVHCIKYYRMIKHPEVVKLSKIFDFGYSSLVEFEVILLQAEYNIFENIINSFDDEILMIAVQSACKNGK